MCRHADWQARQRSECCKISRFQRRPVDIYHRQLEVAVGGSPPMPRQMLEARKTPTGAQSIRDSLGNRRNLSRRAAIGAVADNRVAAGNWNVSERQAVNVNTQGPQVR